MNEINPNAPREQAPEKTLMEIKQMMERSSRFISLSGLSGIAAGICALIGARFAYRMLDGAPIPEKYLPGVRVDIMNNPVILQLLGLAAVTLILAFISAFLLTWRKAKKNNLPVWDHTSRRLIWNVLFPVFTGGLFIFGMLQYGELRFIAPACLVFYGLALINGSKYTLSDIRYLGYLEIILGIINMWFITYGLLFWTIGFGVLHIIYGTIMWWKYERN